MWHPHLKRYWIDETSFNIIDTKKYSKENFPIFLEVKNAIQEKKEENFLGSKTFLPQFISNNRMNCFCKFIKEIKYYDHWENGGSGNKSIQMKSKKLTNIKEKNEFIQEKKILRESNNNNSINGFNNESIELDNLINEKTDDKRNLNRKIFYSENNINNEERRNFNYRNLNIDQLNNKMFQPIKNFPLNILLSIIFLLKGFIFSILIISE